MTRIIDAIDNAVQNAREATRRKTAEHASVKEATIQPRTDLAKNLHDLAAALRTSEGAP